MTAETLSEEERASRALTLLLDNLETANRWLQEVADEHSSAMAKRDGLVETLERGLRQHTGKDRTRLHERFSRLIHRRTKIAARLTGWPKRVLMFLLDQEHETVRAAELTWYARRMGREVGPRYGANRLRELAKYGYVSRVGHGVYQVNRTHPDMLSLRHDAIREHLKRIADRGNQRGR